MVNNAAAANLESGTLAGTATLENATVGLFIGQIILKGVLKKLMGALVLL